MLGRRRRPPSVSEGAQNWDGTSLALRLEQEGRGDEMDEDLDVGVPILPPETFVELRKSGMHGF